ncbi:hypothetical protein V2G26_018281 [Clonostachys chloroleuca]
MTNAASSGSTPIAKQLLPLTIRRLGRGLLLTTDSTARIYLRPCVSYLEWAEHSLGITRIYMNISLMHRRG